MRTVAASIFASWCALLGGCASTGGSNFTPSTGADAATVKARWHRESAFVWEGYRFLSIDDKFVSAGFMSNPTEAVLTIDPGPRSFVVGVEFNRGLGTGPFQSVVSMKAALRPGVTYQLMGEVSGDSVSIWLQDERSKERGSEPASAAWGKGAPNPAVIPIFIPARR
jgi:hypothetical protein